jgi:transcription elongation factor GreA
VGDAADSAHHDPGTGTARRHPRDGGRGGSSGPGLRPAKEVSTESQPNTQRANYLSQEAYDRLASELESLRTEGRERISQQIGAAREHGDIRENADYDAAKNEQGMMEARIRQLEELLRTAVVGEPPESDTVTPGMVIRLQIDGDEETYLLGSREEAIEDMDVLSLKSPLGRAVVGRRPGEEFSYVTPTGRELPVKLLTAEPRH